MNELANIEKDQIVIRIPISGIDYAASVAFEDAGYDDFSVSDNQIFAKELIRALNNEDEEGTTLVHIMLDKACINAADEGAEGLNFPDS